MNIAEEELLEVAWYLSKYGGKKPPTALGVDKWKEAVALFYPRFGTGKSSTEFYNSLKNHRDHYDAWMSIVRTGWRNPDGSPRDLPSSSQRVMQRMNSLSETQIEQKILTKLSDIADTQEQQDLLLIRQDKSLDETTKERLVAARLGQGEFRKKCLKLNPTCAVTGYAFAPMLRASHIKPWSACNSATERLDPYNGLMLAAHIDILFDQGWISFSNDGYILLSNELDRTIINQLSLTGKKIKPFPYASYCYLEWHREHMLR
ncbi:HNH endonuclease [Enterobacteriaceae bacterium ML5]|nr:HNH endonuclease [Enterobacteriaceae bacterium ML5]